MPNPNPRRNYAIDWVRRLAGLGTQTVESASAITGVVTDTPATGSVSGDVTGALLGPLYVQGIHGDEIGRVLAADVNDWDPSGSDALIWDVDFAGFGIRGILAPTVPGEVHIIRAISAGTLYHEDAGSTDVNRLTTASDTDISLTIDSSVVIVYSGTTNRWQVVGGTGGSGIEVKTPTDGTDVTGVSTLRFPDGTVTNLSPGLVDIKGMPAGTIGARVFSSANQTVGFAAALAFDSEEFDTDNFHSTSSNTSRLTCPSGLSGKYLVAFIVEPNGMNANFTWKKNGATNITGSQVWATSLQAEHGAFVVDLVGGDYIEMIAANSAGSGNTTVFGGAVSTVFALTATIIKLDSGRVGTGIGCSVYATGNTSMPNITAVPIAFAAEEFDTDGFHDTVTNNTRLTVPAGLGGIYLVTSQITWDANTTGERIALLMMNGSGFGNGQATVRFASTENGQAQQAVAIVKLAAGSYIELAGYQSSGATRGLDTNYGRTWLKMVRLDSIPSTDSLYTNISLTALNGTAVVAGAGAGVTATLLTTTVTLDPGAYAFQFETHAQSGTGVGTTQLIKDGVGVGVGIRGQALPTPNSGVSANGSGIFTHPGGSTTLVVRFTNEISSTLTFGITSDNRFATRLMVWRIGRSS